MFISLKELERNRVEFSTTFDPGVLDLRGAELEQPSPLVFVGSAELMEGEIFAMYVCVGWWEVSGEVFTI